MLFQWACGRLVVWWGSWKQIYYLDQRSSTTAYKSIITKLQVSNYYFPHCWLSHFPTEWGTGGNTDTTTHRKLFPAYKELSMHLLQTKMSVYLGSTQLGSIPWNYTDWNWNCSGGQSILTQKCIQMLALWHGDWVSTRWSQVPMTLEAFT